MTSRGPAGWDARYADASRPWPAQPSPTVVAAVAALPVGTALDVAAGTGRHARWLARQGWDVTAVDFSAVGVEQGKQRADDLAITWVVADVTRWRPAGSFDLVLVAHVQLGVEGVRRVATWLRPGGRLVVVGHALRNLTDGAHGPRSPELLHTAEQLRDGAEGLEVERLEEVVRREDDGAVVELVLVARRAEAASVPPMRIVIAGGHGQVALRLGRLLAGAGHQVVGLVRDPDHSADLRAAGVEPVVLDLESAPTQDVAFALTDADAVVFAAGAGPGSGHARKDTVDRGAAVLLADACALAGVRRYLLVSSMGVDLVRDGATPEGVEEVFVAYLRAKLAAEEELLARDLELTVLRPGALTDDPGTGRVRLEPSVDRGAVPRDDVAAVLAALLGAPASAARVLELVGGDVPVDAAVAALDGARPSAPGT